MPKSFHTKLSGVTFKNDDGSSRQEIIQHMDEDTEIELIPEPENKFDKNAVGVWVELDEKHQIGYLNRDVAKEVNKFRKEDYYISATISDLTGGGGEKDNIGVNILIEAYSPQEAKEMGEKTERIIREMKAEEEREAKRLRVPEPKWWQIFPAAICAFFVFLILYAAATGKVNFAAFIRIVLALAFFIGLGLLCFLPQLKAINQWRILNKKSNPQR